MVTSLLASEKKARVREFFKIAKRTKVQPDHKSMLKLQERRKALKSNEILKKGRGDSSSNGDSNY